MMFMSMPMRAYLLIYPIRSIMPILVLRFPLFNDTSKHGNEAEAGKGSPEGGGGGLGEAAAGS